MVREFEAALEEKNNPPKKDLENDDVELILPQSLAQFDDYRGIWIKLFNCTNESCAHNNIPEPVWQPYQYLHMVRS